MSEKVIDLPKIEHTPNTYPTKLTSGTIIPGFINAATWLDYQTGRVFAFGREMLGRGNGTPDPSNSTLLTCDSYGNVLEKKVVTRPNEQGEQFEDWRADLTDHGTVVLGATWTAKIAEGNYKPQMAWMEVPSNWNGQLGEIHRVPEAGCGKNTTPWLNGKRILFRRDETPHIFGDYSIGEDNKLDYVGEVHMPKSVENRFIRSGTTYAPNLRSDGTGTGIFHFQEMIGGRLVYSIREAIVHMDGELIIDEVNLERAVTKDSSRLDIPELRQDLQIEVVYMTGKGLYSVADQATVVMSLPR